MVVVVMGVTVVRATITMVPSDSVVADYNDLVGIDWVPIGVSIAGPSHISHRHKCGRQQASVTTDDLL